MENLQNRQKDQIYYALHNSKPNSSVPQGEILISKENRTRSESGHATIS